MSLDQDLRNALGRETEELVVPEPDLHRLLERGRLAVRRRRAARRRTALVAAAVIALVLGIGAALALPSLRDPAPAGRPSPAPAIGLRDLPRGERPSIPYCRGDDLAPGAGQGPPIPGGCLTLVHRGGSTIGFDDTGVRVLRDGGLHLLDPRPSGPWVPALSQDGRYAAWMVAHGTGGRLLVFDLVRGTRVASVRLPTAQAWVPGIDDLDRVYAVNVVNAAQTWVFAIRTGHLGTVQGLPDSLRGGANYVTADGLAVRDRYYFDTGAETSTSVEGVVTPDRHFVPHGTVPIGWSSWSPDRTRLVQEARDGFWVQSADDLDHHVRLRTPGDGRVLASPVWESADSVLMSFDPSAEPGSTVDDPEQGFESPTRRTWTLRCHADSGRCEVALGPGNGGDVRGSMYR